MQAPSTATRGAAHAGVTVNSPALLKKFLLIRSNRCHPAPTPLWRLGGVPGEWADVCGFLKPPESETEWQVRMHGAYTIPYSTLGLREKDQSCHHEIWMHLSHVNAWADERAAAVQSTTTIAPKRKNFAIRPQQRKEVGPLEETIRWYCRSFI